MLSFEYTSKMISGAPDFSYLPFELPLNEWPEDVPGLEEVQHGISRHPVVFIKSNNVLFAIKEMPESAGKHEYEMLSEMREARLPCVAPVGYAMVKRISTSSSILFSRFLDTSVPYRSLFISKAMEQYQNHLLDAIAGLLVQIHHNGFFWGDCSLSNILFRRDAGTLQAYLVDAETAESHLPPLAPMLRYHDLEIMHDNIHGELTDLQTNNHLSSTYPIQETGSYIQQRYRSLWEEITREEVFNSNELYRIDERIRALNSLGFSVRDLELKKEEHGRSLKLRIFVSDRNFHKDQLKRIAGLNAEEKQAQQIMNEINEIKANLSHSDDKDILLEEAANYWKDHVFTPVARKLQTLLDKKPHKHMYNDLIELYCQVLEHKWYLSERVNHDVGHQFAVDDFIQRFS